MGLFLQQGVDHRAALGVRFIATEHVAVTQRAAAQTNDRAGEGGITGKRPRCRPFLPGSVPANFRRAERFIVWRQVKRSCGSPVQQAGYGRGAHPLTGGGVEMHSVLHGEFNHVGAGQADGVLRCVDLAVTVVEGAHAEQRSHVGDLQHLALFRLRAAGADTRLGTFEHKTRGVLQKSCSEPLEKCCSTGQRLRSLK